MGEREEKREKRQGTEARPPANHPFLFTTRFSLLLCVWVSHEPIGFLVWASTTHTHIHTHTLCVCVCVIALLTAVPPPSLPCLPPSLPLYLGGGASGGGSGSLRVWGKYSVCVLECASEFFSFFLFLADGIRKRLETSSPPKQQQQQQQREQHTAAKRVAVRLTATQSSLRPRTSRNLCLLHHTHTHTHILLPCTQTHSSRNIANNISLCCIVCVDAFFVISSENKLCVACVSEYLNDSNQQTANKSDSHSSLSDRKKKNKKKNKCV